MQKKPKSQDNDLFEKNYPLKGKSINWTNELDTYTSKSWYNLEFEISRKMCTFSKTRILVTEQKLQQNKQYYELHWQEALLKIKEKMSY